MFRAGQVTDHIRRDNNVLKKSPTYSYTLKNNSSEMLLRQEYRRLVQRRPRPIGEVYKEPRDLETPFLGHMFGMVYSKLKKQFFDLIWQLYSLYGYNMIAVYKHAITEGGNDETWYLCERLCGYRNVEKQSRGSLR